MLPRRSERLVYSSYPPTVMISSPGYEKAIAIAMSLLKHQNAHTVQMLKDLLTFIPNPNHVKEILKVAVLQLIHTCPESSLWLFQHPDVIEPEIQVRKIIVRELTQKLFSLGYTLEDFRFTDDYALEMNEDSKRVLLSYQPKAADEPILALIYALLL